AREWTAAEAAAELRAPEPWVGTQLAELTALGVAAPRDARAEAYVFLADGRWAAAIAEVGEQFAQRRTSIIKAIIGPPDDELRSFSDAFRLREGGDEEGR